MAAYENKGSNPVKTDAWILLDKYQEYYSTRPYVYKDIVKFKELFYEC